MRHTILLAILICISSNAAAQALEYLEEKTAFCYSEHSLGKYLKMAKSRNIDGLNQLILSGECNFVPDGEIMSLSGYRTDSIGSMPIVAFEKDNQELWTFRTFVQKTEIGSL